MDYYFYILFLHLCVVDVLGKGCVKIDFSRDEQLSNCLGLDSSNGGMFDSYKNGWKINSYNSVNAITPFDQKSMTYISPLESNIESCSLFTLNISHGGQIQVNFLMSKMPNAYLYIKVFETGNNERVIVDWSSIESVGWKEMEWSTISLRLPNSGSGYFSIAIVGVVKKTGMLMIDSILYNSLEFDEICEVYKGKIKELINITISTTIEKASEGYLISKLLAPHAKNSTIDSSNVNMNRKKKEAIPDSADYEHSIQQPWELPQIKFNYNKIKFGYRDYYTYEMNNLQVYIYVMDDCPGYVDKSALQKCNKAFLDETREIQKTKKMFEDLVAFHKKIEKNEEDTLNYGKTLADFRRRIEISEDEIEMLSSESMLDEDERMVRGANDTACEGIVKDIKKDIRMIKRNQSDFEKKDRKNNKLILKLKKRINKEKKEITKYKNKLENQKSLDMQKKTDIEHQLQLKKDEELRLRNELSELKTMILKVETEISNTKAKKVALNKQNYKKQKTNDNIWQEKKYFDIEMPLKEQEYKELQEKNKTIERFCGKIQKKNSKIQRDIDEEKTKSNVTVDDIDIINTDLKKCFKEVSDVEEKIAIILEQEAKYDRISIYLKQRTQPDYITSAKHNQTKRGLEEKRQQAEIVFRKVEAERNEKRIQYENLRNETDIKNHTKKLEHCKKTVMDVFNKLNKQKNKNRVLQQKYEREVRKTDEKKAKVILAFDKTRKRYRESKEKVLELCEEKIKSLGQNRKNVIEIYLWVGWNLLIIAILIFIVVMYMTQKLNTSQK